MKITPVAAKTISNIMKKVGLDPAIYAVYLSKPQYREGCAINFTKEDYGDTFQFEDLRVIVAYDLNTENLIIDLYEVNGKKGIIFLGE